jgi:hypothetical protein
MSLLLQNSKLKSLLALHSVGSCMVRSSDVLFPRGPYALLGVQAIPASAPADPDNDIEIPLSTIPQTPFTALRNFSKPHPPIKIHTRPKVNEFRGRYRSSWEGVGGALSSSWYSPPWESFCLATKWTQAALPPRRSALRYTPYWSCI